MSNLDKLKAKTQPKDDTEASKASEFTGLLSDRRGPELPAGYVPAGSVPVQINLRVTVADRDAAKALAAADGVTMAELFRRLVSEEYARRS